MLNETSLKGILSYMPGVMIFSKVLIFIRIVSPFVRLAHRMTPGHRQCRESFKNPFLLLITGEPVRTNWL